MAAIHGGVRRLFGPDVFSMTFNYPSHGLSFRQVTETLDKFERDGLITGKDIIDWDGQPDKEVLVTQKGGQLWEAERDPDWSRFLDARYRGRLIITGSDSSSMAILRISVVLILTLLVTQVCSTIEQAKYGPQLAVGSSFGGDHLSPYTC